MSNKTVRQPVKEAMLRLLALLLAVATTACAQAPLKITFIDVEGGQATLFVSPTGQSLLIDTGWAGNNGRDAERIVQAAHQAGLTKLDYVLITHFHADHVGGVPQLVARMPVGTFIDHGPNREDNPAINQDYAAYQQIIASTHARHIVPSPGDHLPIQGFDALVLSADGKVISGAGKRNPFCATSELRPADQTENARSLGIELTFGKLKILDLGDLTWDKERDLMCPGNRIGKVDILVVSHHGWYQSSSPALIDAIAPRVAVMDNGAKKGGSIPTLQTLRKSPGLETLWQLHYSDEGGVTNNTAPDYIANPQGPDAGNPLVLEALPDGHFSVTNPRAGFSKNY